MQQNNNYNMIELHHGNLLKSDAEALVNTVNIVGIMGKGIALQFKKAFPDMFTAYKLACKNNEIRPGKIHVYKRKGLLNPHYIINFPTKTHWRGRSKIEYIEKGLHDLVRIIRQEKIRSIAVPPLGCGLGGLDWNDVYSEIKKSLTALENVQVIVFPPKGAPNPEEMINRTERPEMTPTRANVLRILADYLVLGYQLSLLEVQKLLYFFQEAGEPLRLRFTEDKYGPYADNLRHVMNLFEGHFTSGFGDGRNSPDTEIKLLSGALEEAESYLKNSNHNKSLSQEHADKVMKLIEGFESPYSMEVLSSVHWVTEHQQNCNVKTADEAIQAIHQWNDRKARMLKPPHIRIAWQRLVDEGWI